MLRLYRHTEWQAFRDAVLEIDQHRCSVCQRGPDDGVVLQVHHRYYIPGKAPWEYPLDALETLCRGCHAREHHRLPPASGWELTGIIDYEDDTQHCECCGHTLRFGHVIQHPDWVTQIVGSACCDALTGRRIADETLQQARRCSRLIQSSRWIEHEDGERLQLRRHVFTVSPRNSGYQLYIDAIPGRHWYPNIESAKERCYTLLASGNLDACLRRATQAMRAASPAPEYL